MKTVCIETPAGSFRVGPDAPPLFILGPCVIESRDHAFEVAGALAEIRDRLNIQIVFKASYDKANRSSGKSFRGVGMSAGLSILEDIRSRYSFPVISDIHESSQVEEAASVLDILQIPALLSRQTDLLEAAARSGRVVHIKKGQFMAPEDMSNVVKKMEDSGCDRFMLCERGISFGYHALVVDFRSLPVMASFGYPVIFDATHAVQTPGGGGDRSGGDRRFVPALARAAMAVGCQGLFMEVHPDPDHAPSDGPNMIPLAKLEGLILSLLPFVEARKNMGADPLFVQERA
ncbi:MAG: 3-deoxy-8-phosphooctulonate synthase [Nitrospiraceae bacterium]|nr:3-deoxy-8-phosphooctulonate synthase [Nitrospiraceae bacterium]